MIIFEPAEETLLDQEKDGEASTRGNRISQKAANGDRNILLERLLDPIIFMEITDCHNYKTSCGTEWRKFERGFILQAPGLENRE